MCTFFTSIGIFKKDKKRGWSSSLAPVEVEEAEIDEDTKNTWKELKHGHGVGNLPNELI